MTRNLKSDFNKDKLQIVDIDLIKFNDYNPKQKKSKQWLQVKRSIEINGFRSPVVVSEITDPIYKYELIDGEQRITAAKDLGYKQVYVINEGKLSDEERKNLTIWYMTHVEPDYELLAPLVKEMVEIDLEMPFDADSINDFLKLDKAIEEPEPLDPPTERYFEPLTIQCMKDQIDEIRNGLSLIAREEHLTEGETLLFLINSYK